MRTVEMDSLDNLVERHSLKPALSAQTGHPRLRGSDHGGSGACARTTQVVIMECYLLRADECDRPMFWEMCDWMEKRGFRCFGVSSIPCSGRATMSSGRWTCSSLVRIGARSFPI